MVAQFHAAGIAVDDWIVDLTSAGARMVED
jgi:hypothetical protein